MTGSGTAADPYKIYDVNDLQAVENDLTAYYELANDIDASETSTWNAGAGFVPISWFEGSFDGKGFTINQLTINRPTTSGVGLFGYTWDFAAIKNVRLTLCDITGRDYVGALVGDLYGYPSVGIAEVEDCSSSGDVSGRNFVGGLFGEASAAGDLHIRDCYSSCTITATGDDAGGFAGRITDCNVSRCYATGDVTINAGDIFTEGGGFAGHLFAGITSECYATGNVVVNNNSATRRAEAGGFTGAAGLTIGETLTFVVRNSYARGNVTANNAGGDLEYAGGFIGRFYEDDGTIEDCYSTGTASGYNHGGFCAEWGGVNTSINDCFWDTETSGEATSDGGTGKTTEEMKTRSTFTDADWGLTTIWHIKTPVNNSYLCLLGVTPNCCKWKGNPNIDQLIYQHVERMER